MVEQMLLYIYTKDYESIAPAEVPLDHVLAHHIDMYTMADKYDIPGLRKLCVEKFSVGMKKPSEVINFPSLIRLIYESTPENDRGLRDVISKVAREHLAELIKNDDFAEVLKSVGAFAHDILRNAVWREEKMVQDDILHGGLRTYSWCHICQANTQGSYAMYDGMGGCQICRSCYHRVLVSGPPSTNYIFSTAQPMRP